MTDARRRITLDLEFSGMPVEGRLALEGGEQRSFIGYAGLIAALEAIRSGDEQEARWRPTSDGTKSG